MAHRAEEAFRPVVTSALELALSVGWAEVHLLLCVSSVSVDSVCCHLGELGIRLCGFDEA